MSKRGITLLERANGQISEMIDLLSACGEAALIRPNPARQKLGDGTVGASALHTADNYHRIAGIVRASCPRLGKQSHREHNHLERGGEQDDHRADNVDLQALLDRLAAGRSTLGLLAELTDEQLDSVPRAGSARFADGKRTLEQVVGGALKHQRRNVDALRAAVA